MIIFTAILRFISIELSQVSQLLAVGLCLGGLRICDLWIYGLWIYGLWICGLWIYDLNNRGRVLARILVYRDISVCDLGYGGIAVHSLRIGCVLARKINSKAAQVYGINLVKWVRYKASCYGPSVTSVSVTKAGLAGTNQRDRRSRTIGRGLSKSHGSVQYMST